MTKSKVEKALAAYRAKLDSGVIEEVRMGDLKPGDVTNANVLPAPREVRSVTTVTVCGKRVDALVTFTDGSTVQRYSGQVTTRRGKGIMSKPDLTMTRCLCGKALEGGHLTCRECCERYGTEYVTVAEFYARGESES